MRQRGPVSRSISRLGRALRGALRARPGEPATRRPPPADELRFDYAPELDGDPDPGEVVWGWVPYEEDPTQGKDRPVVVVGTRGRVLVGVPLTSKRDDRDPQVAVGSGPWDRDGRPSYARVDRLLDLPRESIRREGAVLPRDRFDAVVAGVVRHRRDAARYGR